ncbi:VWA domain-containing protein [Haloferula sp. A504]|uniref:vWA domain-containing protein n=1 Tax=Haloferula sp. A504 TaxID=3373601 RepID=UPI0031BBE81C|nr:VWA domain-containing protein [Verrucomicrobiaceae bacterium E54]
MTLAEPRWLLLLLLLPLLATGAVLVARLRSARWQAFVAPRLRSRLIRRASPVPRWISLACLLLALALLIICLARPQSNRGTRTDSIMGRNILMVLDLSRSMETPDIKPSRLAQAKTTCYELLEALPNDRIGLVGFAGSAYLFAPLTVDHHAVRETITEVEIDWIPTGGSNLVGGLELGIETLKETGTRQNAIILMSDGEEHVGRIAEVAEKANAAGIEVITIGFGTTEGDFVPDPTMADGRFRDRSGSEVISRLEPRPLERLATLTGGRFAIASSGADIPAMVETAVADLDRVQMEGRERTVVVDYYQWFLLPAILLLIGSVVAATRWRGVGTAPATAATALLALFLLLPQASAASYSDARQALSEKRFADAAAAFGSLAEQHRDSEKGFRYHLAQGTAAYQSGDYPTARRAFSEALRSRSTEVLQAAHHGLGNTLFQIGWQRLSGGLSYPGVPEEKEEDATDSEEKKEEEAFDRLSDALLDMPDEADVEGLTLGRFEKMAKERLAEWMAEETEEGEESRGSQRFNSLLTDWIDAVRHFDGAQDFEDSRHNRELTVKHLKKLREIFDQLEENAQQIQAIPQPSPGENGEGEPQEGEGDGEPQDGEGEPRDQGQPNDSGEDPQDGSGDEDQEQEGNGDEGEEDEGDGETDEGEETGAKPGETEEDAARRILRENADLQKGALSPGRIEYRRPEKDW